MIGHVIVKFVVYLVRWFRREQLLRSALDWTPTESRIADSKVRGGEVEIVYTYQFDGGYFSSSVTRDFFWSQSADCYAKHLERTTALAIRVIHAHRKNQSSLMKTKASRLAWY
jgi:hypothetical protein